MFEVGVRFPIRPRTRDRAIALGRRYHLAVFEVSETGERTRIDEDPDLVIGTHYAEVLTDDSNSPASTDIAPAVSADPDGSMVARDGEANAG